MQIYRVHHVTTYRYRRPVEFYEHRMMLTPRRGHDQQPLSSSLVITPEPTTLRFSDDPLGNRVGIARFGAAAASLVFDSRVRVALSRSHPAGFNLDDRARTMPIAFDADELADLAPFLACRHRAPHDAVDEWARRFLENQPSTPTIEFLVAMINGIRGALTYVRRTEKGTQDPALTLALGSGSCRDFTELMIEAVRRMGIPARFVSGYLYVPSSETHEVHGGGATHAWLQVYLPGAGWIDIDPTNAILGNEGLIRVAIARDASDTIPLYGSYRGSAGDDMGMEVVVKVSREQSGDVELPADGRA